MLTTGTTDLFAAGTNLLVAGTQVLRLEIAISHSQDSYPVILKIFLDIIP